MRILLIKIALAFILILLPGSTFSQSERGKGRVKVAPGGHYLQYADGTPFFWLGDTAWELLSRARKEEIEQYLEDRRQKGFNLIQVVTLAYTDEILRVNQYGDFPFINNNPETPNESYFQLVDWVLQRALAKGMVIGLFPTWGDRVAKFWAKGPVIFNEQNAYSYGLFLGKRYKDYPNIIWISGGDRPAFTDSMDWRPVWRAMIKGVREGTGGKALVTYHPWGEHSSSEFWKGEDENMLDINMLQSGHAGRDIPVWDWINRDYHISPPKPVLDGEPNYEDHPVDWKSKNGYFRDYDIRKQLYRSVFAGACGVTYGHWTVKQFYSSREEKWEDADLYWTEAIDRPGAFQAGYLKKLILSRPPLSRIPDQTIIKSGQGEKGAYITAFRDADSSYAMVYLPIGKKVEVDVSWMKAEKIAAWWFNPRTCEALKIGLLKKKDSLRFVPPATGIENDWVLVLDDSAREWPAPGVSPVRELSH